MSETKRITNGADITTLERLAEQMQRDAMRNVSGLNASAVLSIVDIIRQAIGAPINWPSRVDGLAAAEAYYPGSPDLRHGFNAGVKWAVEHYHPSVVPSHYDGGHEHEGRRDRAGASGSVATIPRPA
jgi:hypothetical protein